VVDVFIPPIINSLLRYRETGCAHDALTKQQLLIALNSPLMAWLHMIGGMPFLGIRVMFAAGARHVVDSLFRRNCICERVCI